MAQDQGHTSTITTPDDYVRMASELTEDQTSTWKPEEGDAIAGTIMGIEAGTGSKGDSTLIDIERIDTQEIISVWLSATLEKQFTKQKAGIGDIVGIKYFGRRTAERSGREFKAYSFKVFKRRATEFEDDIPF
jgi:hypothetical protein